MLKDEWVTTSANFVFWVAEEKIGKTKSLIVFVNAYLSFAIYFLFFLSNFKPVTKDNSKKLASL